MLEEAGHIRADLLEKTLMLGLIEGKRKRGWQRLIKAWCAAVRWVIRVGHNLVTEQQQQFAVI